jgi:streptogramin lyase
MFAASTGATAAFTVSFDWYATTQGEAKLQLQYATDGSTWHNAPLTLSALDTGRAASRLRETPLLTMGIPPA